MLLMTLLFQRRGESSPPLPSSAPCVNHWMEFLGNKNNSRAFSSLTVTPYLSVSSHSPLWESAASFNEIHPDSSVGYYSACERSECSEPALLCCSALWLYAQRLTKVGEWTLKQIQSERSHICCLYFLIVRTLMNSISWALKSLCLPGPHTLTLSICILLYVIRNPVMCSAENRAPSLKDRDLNLGGRFFKWISCKRKKKKKTGNTRTNMSHLQIITS